MNILYYCDEYPPVPHGGIGTVVQIVAEAMAARGHRVIVAGRYLGHEKTCEDEFLNGVQVIRWYNDAYRTIPIYLASILAKIAKKPGGRMTAQLKWNRTESLLNSIIRRDNIDIVEFPDHVNELFKTTGLRSHRLKAPAIARIHGSASFLHYFYYHESDQAKESQDACHLNRADAICAVSQFSRQFIINHLLPNRKVDVIYNPIPDAMFEHVTEVSNSNTIVYFGRVAEFKGVHSLLKAFNVVARRHAEVRLKLIGEGEIEEAKRIVNPEVSHQVEFTGFMQKSDLVKEIDNALFCVLPSYLENFSMAALEVMARQRALIYTSRASGPELIEEGVNGFMVDPDNVDALAERMEQLIIDPSLRQHLAERGYHTCRTRFAASVIMPQLEAYYKEHLVRIC